MADWSSLPGDLVNRIADRLLATDDLDYYMDLRAVCHGWRSSTADPKNDNARFRPRQWAMLDEVHQSDERLFVNLGTGRFVRKNLPLLRRNIVVASAAGGSVVLANATRVLNPFTGAMITFEAWVPCMGEVAAHVIGSKPTLVLLKGAADLYWADPDSKSFIEGKVKYFRLPPIRSAIVGGIYAAARENGSLASLLVPEANKILDLAAKPFAQYFAGGAEERAVNRCFLVESGGEILIVFKLPHRCEVFRINTRNNLLQRVTNLRSRAIFVADHRCLSVDADNFTAVKHNCIYYVVVDVEDPFPAYYNVCVYSLKDETEEVIGDIDYNNPFRHTIAPSSDVKFLCWYTFDSQVHLSCRYTLEVLYSQFESHQILSCLEQVNVLILG